MQLGQIDADLAAPPPGEQQELAAGCVLDEAPLAQRQPEGALHVGRLGRPVATEEHRRAVGRDHRSLLAAEQVLDVLRGHHQRGAVLAAAAGQLDEQVAERRVHAERAHLVEHDVTAPPLSAHPRPQPLGDQQRGRGHELVGQVAQ